LNTDTLTADRVIAVDYGMSLLAMVAAGNYDWKHNAITADRFPIEGTGTKRFRPQLFHFGRIISSDDAIAAIKAEKAENFTPASHVHGLAYGAAFPEEQRKYNIACLGSSAQVYCNRSVVCLRHGFDARRYLDLCRWAGICAWPDYWRFLAVQEVSAA